MKRSFAPLCLWRLLAVLVALLLLCGCADAPDDQGTVSVSHVLDGDTVVLEDGQHLRLWGVDAPELAHDNVRQQYYARESKEGLLDLVHGALLQLIAAPTPKDRYGRLLGALRLPDGQLVNEVLVRQGLAFCYPHPATGDWLHERLLDAQRQAMGQGRGFWPGLLQRSGDAGAMTGNRRSRRFFSPGCSGAEGIAARNRRIFADLRAAFHAGYAPARHCGLWPAAQ